MKHTDPAKLSESTRNDGLNLNRRSLLKNSLLGAAGLAFGGLASRDLMAASLPYSPNYGPLSLKADETTGLYLLALPEGFRYQSFGWAGDRMSDGIVTPRAHDGMGVVAAKGNTVTMIRNHEIRGVGDPFTRLAYDPRTPGGNTVLTFDTYQGKWLDSYAALSGTSTNCAGGPTPWGSWLTCEETTLGPETEAGVKTHGWVFEVPAFGRPSAEPLKALGRFVHEAVAVDPVTSIVYETEDRGTSGFYRFIPNTHGRLQDGGTLQMLKVVGEDQADLSRGFPNDTTWQVEWVDIEDPERAHEEGTTNSLGVYSQGRAKGGARFERGEGCWYDSGYVYFVSTSGGDAGQGQIFEYDPRSETLRLVFESPAADILNSPDNIAVSPRGGIVLCEDGSRPKQMLHGLTRDGEIFPFAENNVILAGEKNGFSGNYTGREWCGATFYNQWLFVNIQTPGITFAITGPWDNGAL